MLMAQEAGMQVYRLTRSGSQGVHGHVWERYALVSLCSSGMYDCQQAFHSK